VRHAARAAPRRHRADGAARRRADARVGARGPPRRRGARPRDPRGTGRGPAGRGAARRRGLLARRGGVGAGHLDLGRPAPDFDPEEELRRLAAT
jgi:hypothetical protein